MDSKFGASPFDTSMLKGGLQLVGAVTLGGFGLGMIVLCTMGI
ncbi:MAG TPA: hypothetical protein VEI97_11435 [bacterium]|nr:hypothetical protein [bacterium]